MNKRILSCAVCGALAAAGLSASAQDVIVKRDGSTVLSKVLEITTSEVKYKKWSNRDGPTYSVSKAELVSINYENGDKDDFSQIADAGVNNETAAANAAPAAANHAPTPKMTEAEIKAMNDSIRARYNVSCIEYKPEYTGKKTRSFFVQYFATDDSRFADEFVELSYRMGQVLRYKKSDPHVLIPSKDEPYMMWVGKFKGGFRHIYSALEVVVKNKSDRTIYVDLGNSFMSYAGEARSLYVPMATSTMNSGTSGVGVNLGSVAGALGVGGAVGKLAGGVNVGGSSTKATTNVTYSQRVISIPPHSSKTLDLQPLIPNIEQNYEWPIERDKTRKSGNHLTFQPGEMPKLDRSFFLSYSFTEDVIEQRTISTNLYAKDVLCLRNRGGVASQVWLTKDVTIGCDNLFIAVGY